MSYGKAIDALIAGPPPPKRTKITITEGRTRAEASKLLAKTSLQGSYFNATRTLAAAEPAQLRRAQEHAQVAGGIPLPGDLRRPPGRAGHQPRQPAARRPSSASSTRSASRKARKAKLTAYDVLIIASMIEREVFAPQERRLVSAVIYNRLRQGIPLGIDATMRYETANQGRPIRDSELTRDTPYNTRTRKGLPPTPIGNPGLASIRAAANPAKVDYLYFVVKPGTCNRMAFSSTDAQFQKDADRYNAAREANGGKSPTKC